MYFRQIVDQIGDSINDSTLKWNGANAARTKGWVQQFYHLDLMPRLDWKSNYKEGTISVTASTQRYSLPRWIDHPSKIVNLLNASGTPLTQVIVYDVTGENSSDLNPPGSYSFGPRTRTTYTTGTVSGTSATKVLTGSSTAWTSSNIAQYDYIQVGDYAYTVDSVDSATQITVFEDLSATVSASSYTAILDRWTIDLWPIPLANTTLTVNARKIIEPLVNSYDIPELPDNWHWILVQAGLVKALQHNKEDYQGEATQLEINIRRMIKEDLSEADRFESVQIPRSRSY